MPVEIIDRPARSRPPPDGGQVTRAGGRVGRARAGYVLAGLTLLAVVAIGLSLGLGSNLLPPAEVWRALSDPDGGEAATIVRDVRLPRTVLGLLVGMALGVAGALIQGHTRNPLADAGLLGVSTPAPRSLVVLSMYLFGFSAPERIPVVRVRRVVRRERDRVRARPRSGTARRVR